MCSLLALPTLTPLQLRQLQLPVCLGGFGLRSAARAAPAAYWASTGDCLHVLASRFPGEAHFFLDEFVGRSSLCPSLLAAANAGHELSRCVNDRPSWAALHGGARPLPRPMDEVREPGDWAHGWQFYASNALEQREHNLLLEA